ncbi:DUF397 domain-containing protein [Nocardia carnea]
MTNLSTANLFKSSRSSGQHNCVEVAFLGVGRSACAIRRTQPDRR